MNATYAAALARTVIDTGSLRMTALNDASRSQIRARWERSAGMFDHVATRRDEITPRWRLVHIGLEGGAVEIDGLNPWTVSGWGPSIERITVAHPSCPPQRHTIWTYRVPGPSALVEFTAGEFSNRVWGLYERG